MVLSVSEHRSDGDDFLRSFSYKKNRLLATVVCCKLLEKCHAMNSFLVTLVIIKGSLKRPTMLIKFFGEFTATRARTHARKKTVSVCDV